MLRERWQGGERGRTLPFGHWSGSVVGLPIYARFRRRCVEFRVRRLVVVDLAPLGFAMVLFPQDGALSTCLWPLPKVIFLFGGWYFLFVRLSIWYCHFLYAAGPPFGVLSLQVSVTDLHLLVLPALNRVRQRMGSWISHKLVLFATCEGG